MDDLRRKQRRALIVALLAIGAIFLTLVVAVLATPASGASLRAGQALTQKGVLRALHDVRCRWHLTVSGGQQPNSPIVLRLTNTCVDNGGPQVQVPLGTLP